MLPTTITAAQIREQRHACLALLAAEFQRGVPMAALQQRLTAFYDQKILALLQSCAGVDTTSEQWPLCLAVGGYGRGALSPASDLDLVWITGATPRDEDIVRAVHRQLWDAGIEIGNSTRTLAECGAMLQSGELRGQTTLLDARVIGGSPLLMQAWQRVARRVRWSQSWRRQMVDGKIAEMQRRHARHGDSPYLLEPNVKEGMGGLRDWHTLGWIGAVSGIFTTSLQLRDADWLAAAEYERLVAAVEFLERVRWALHSAAGRRQDRLGFAEQDHLAAQWFQKNMATTDATVRLMQAYYQSVSVIREVSEWLMWRWTARYAMSWPRRVVREWFPHVAKTLRGARRLTIAAHAVQKIFAAVAQTQTALTPVVRHALANASLTASAADVAALIPAWRGVRGVALMLREMHRTGWLVKFFPDVVTVLYRVQRDAYHCYSIDLHLMQAVQECEQLLCVPDDAVSPSVLQARRLVDAPTAVLLAAWYHDMGKGQRKPHAQVGAALVEKMAARLGLNADEQSLARFLVQSHQILPLIAFTRDLNDDALIEHVAATVQTMRRLSALYLVSIADLRAVGPGLFTEWKQTLLHTLYRRTLDFLQQGEHTEPTLEELRAACARDCATLLQHSDAANLVTAWVNAMPVRYLRQTSAVRMMEHIELWYAFGEEVVGVYWVQENDGTIQVDLLARDARGVLAKFCGVLTAHGMNIVEAHVFSGTHGYVIDRFRCVAPSRFRDAAAWEQLRSDLGSVLQGLQSVDTLLARRTPSRLQPMPRVTVRHEVVIDNAMSEEYSVIDVHARDRVGLLYAMTQHFFAAGCDILAAKILTVGAQVHDAWYVRDADGGKITDAVRLAALQESLTAVTAEDA